MKLLQFFTSAQLTQELHLPAPITQSSSSTCSPNVQTHDRSPSSDPRQRHHTHDSSIKTHNTHKPTEIYFLRPTAKSTSPSSKMQTTNHRRDLLPQTHDRASKESKPTIPTIPTNQHISPSSGPRQRPLQQATNHPHANAIPFAIYFIQPIETNPASPVGDAPSHQAQSSR